MKARLRGQTVLLLVAVLAACGGLLGCDDSSAHSRLGPASHGWQVTRVVDGDTLEVTSEHSTLTVRLIGIDTPETVHPSEPVECFGPEASAWTNRRLLNEEVFLEFDPSQGRTDVYNRTLAYVWVEQDQALRLFNEVSLRRGFAREYTYEASYAWQHLFLNAEAAARSHSRGLWSSC